MTELLIGFSIGVVIATAVTIRIIRRYQNRDGRIGELVRRVTIATSQPKES